MDFLRGLEVGGILPLRVGLGVNAEILRLHLDELFEVGMIPILNRILVDAAPDGIDELQLTGEGLFGHGGGGGIPGLTLHQGVFDVVPVEVFVLRAPAAEFLIVAGEVLLFQGLDSGGGTENISLESELELIGDGGAGAGVVDDGLEHGTHLQGREKALALDDLAAVGIEDDGGGPAIFLVAIGEVGAGILIDPHREIARADERDDLGIRVGLVVHDVAPVTPDGLEIEEHEFVLAFGLLENRIGPGVPIDFFGMGRRFIR